MNDQGVFVKAGYLKPTGKIRMINGGSNTFNIRDIGGWDCDGGTLKYGRIFRGSELDGNNYNVTIDDDQKRMFTEFLNIQDDIDLRSDQQVRGSDGEVGTDDDIISSCFGNQFPYVRFQIAPYSVGVNFENTSQMKYYSNLIRRIINDAVSEKTCYIHCMAGADRTGTICYLMEAICGVSESDLDKEYELTGFTANKRNRDNREWLAFKEKINNFPGNNIRNKVIDYALALGITMNEINAFRETMIDGIPEKLTVKDIK